MTKRPLTIGDEFRMPTARPDIARRIGRTFKVRLSETGQHVRAELIGVKDDRYIQAGQRKGQQLMELRVLEIIAG